MATLNIELVSTETIKPSSATPKHLTIFELSELDQQVPRMFVPLILFYNADAGTESRSEALKTSLSEILTQFYPLAGRIEDNRYINCNDEGVSFSVARVRGHTLDQVVNHPQVHQLDQLVPKDDQFDSNLLLHVQLSIFDCHGMALGLSISHKLFDASSMSFFISNWAAITNGSRSHDDDDDDVIVPPKFELKSLFPPKDIINSLPPSEYKFSCKRFVVDAKNIDALKLECSNHLFVQNPTRVESVTALLWKCAMNVVKKATVESVSTMMLPVNMRSKMIPPLSNSSIGNILIGASATSRVDKNTKLCSLVDQLRKGIARVVSHEYLEKLSVEGGLSKHWDSVYYEVIGKAVKGERNLFCTTSWCRFPFYEADFGWGRPVWATTFNLYCSNSFILMDTKCGNGVEAWVCLDEDDMARLECDSEFVAFTSPKQNLLV